MARTGTRWWSRAKTGGGDPVPRQGPPLRPPPALAPPPRPGVGALAARVVGLLGEAARLGVPTGPLRAALVRAGALGPADGPPRADELAGWLGGLDPGALARVRAAAVVFAERLDAAANGPIAVVSDPVAATTWMWWDAREQAAGEDAGSGRVVLVEVRGEDGAEDGAGAAGALTVLVHPVEDPRPDFRKALTSRAVGQALDRARRGPPDPTLRAAALTALSRAPVAAGAGWTTAFAEPRPREARSDLPSLSGTVAVVGSTGVEVGARTVRRSAVLHTVSPTVAAAMLLVENPDLVNALVDVAVAAGDGTAGAAFAAALVAARAPDPATSEAARATGTVHRPPEAGTTVRIAGAPGGGSGVEHYAGKNRHLLPG
jgi:hypothetical protein